MELNKMEEITNYAKVSGKICSEVKISHEIEGEKFYEFKVEVNRLSQAQDVIPVTVSEHAFGESKPKTEDFVQVSGEYRSYNKIQDDRSRLILHLFAKEMKVLQREEFENYVKLSGYICKEPVYRKTPFDREICDVLLAVNRPNLRKSDYIPCIAWGRNARFVGKQKVGCRVEFEGRIQSREYRKAQSDGSVETKTAYEVSCQNVRVLDNVTSLEPVSVGSGKVAND